MSRGDPKHELQGATVVFRRADPNPHLAKARLLGTASFVHDKCGRTFNRTASMLKTRTTWQTWRCDCGEMLRVPQTRF